MNCGAKITNSDLLAHAGHLLRQPSLAILEEAHAQLALSADESSAPLLAIRGEILRRRGDVKAAANLLEQAIAQASTLFAAYHCAALAHVAAGNRARARAIWHALLQHDLDDPIVRYQIGVTFHDEGNFAAAIDWYEQHLHRSPDALPAWYNLGLAALAQGDHGRAITALSTVTARDARHRRAWIALGRARMLAQDREGAVEAWLTADRLAPRDTEPLKLAAAELARQLELPAAINLLDRALSLDRADPSLHWARGSHLSNLGLHAAAMAAFREALALNPADDRGESRLLLELHYDETLASPDEVAQAHFSWAERHIRARTPRSYAAVKRFQSGRLRVGYLSPRFGAGPLATLFLPVLLAHDPANVHVTLYSAWPHGDSVAARMKAAAHEWRELSANDDEAAEAIASDDLDILIDLAGHAPGNRLHVLARKPARVQCCWLDYFDTSGLDAVDYLISDAVHTPTTDAPYFSERLVLLPGCRFVYSPIVAPSIVPPPCSAKGYVTFGSFNRHAKITDSMLRTWQTILDRVPRSRLQLRSAVYGGKGSLSWLRDRWRSAGISVDRIDFHPFVAVDEAMRAYADIDIALDPAPYNGGVTTCDALISGVPVVTLRGDRMIARQGASLLNAAGRHDWTADSLPGYIDLAVRLADSACLADERAQLAADVQRSSLCDVRQFVSRFESTLHQLVALGPKARPAGHPVLIQA